MPIAYLHCCSYYAWYPYQAPSKKQTQDMNVRKRNKINHLLFMDDVKLHGKSSDRIHLLVRMVQLFSTDIRTEFGIKKCAALTLKRRKVVEYDGTILTDD